MNFFHAHPFSESNPTNAHALIYIFYIETILVFFFIPVSSCLLSISVFPVSFIMSVERNTVCIQNWKSTQQQQQIARNSLASDQFCFIQGISYFFQCIPRYTRLNTRITFYTSLCPSISDQTPILPQKNTHPILPQKIW